MWMSVYSRVIGNNILRRLESRFHASKIKVGSSKMSSTNLAMRTIGKPNSKDFRVYLGKFREKRGILIGKKTNIIYKQRRRMGICCRISTMYHFSLTKRSAF